MSTLRINEDPLDLAKEILDNPKTSKEIGLLKCVQCGMCTSTCPSAKNSDYNPRDMIEKVLEGNEDIISDKNIWKCFYCYTCHSICPVGNSACEVNQVLRQIAISKGIGIEEVSPFSGFGDSMLNLGLGGIPENFFEDLTRDIGKEWMEKNLNLNKIRKELGLKPLKMPKESIEEIRTLLEKANFNKRLEKIKNNEK